MRSNQPNNQPRNPSTIQTNYKKTLRNQPSNILVKQLTVEHSQAKQPEVELYNSVY